MSGTLAATATAKVSIACHSEWGTGNFAQEIRIRFAKGKSSADVKGTTGKHGVTYTIRARGGQRLVLDLTPANKVGIKVETKGRYGEMVLLREEVGGHYEVGLEETGDYTIFIGPSSGKSEAFDLRLAVARMSDI
jgi:hypothetical protein